MPTDERAPEAPDLPQLMAIIRAVTGELDPSEALAAEGHQVHVCYSMQEARGVIERYLALPKR